MLKFTPVTPDMVQRNRFELNSQPAGLGDQLNTNDEPPRSCQGTEKNTSTVDKPQKTGTWDCK